MAKLVEHKLPATFQRLFCADCKVFLGYEYYPERIVTLRADEIVEMPHAVALVHVCTCDNGTGPHNFFYNQRVGYVG